MRDQQLDERAERELASIEEALATGTATAADARERELQQLALALRADVPAARPEFRAALDRRVGTWSGRPAGSRGWLPRLTVARVSGAFAVAACLLAGLVVAGVMGTDRDGPVTALGERGDGAEGGGGAAIGEPQPLQGDDTVAAPPGRAPAAADAGGRHVERSATLTLAAPERRLEQVGREVAEVATRRGGFVQRSSLSTGDRGAGGYYELRVPSAALAVTLDELSRLATVRRRTQADEDITAAVDAAADRLRAARAERRGLLRRLEQVDSVREAAELRRAIARADAEIRGRTRDLRAVRRRAELSTVTVSLVRSRAAEGPLARAFDDARKVFVAIVGLAVRALGVLVPLAVPAGLAALAAAATRRRRREAVLGPS